jgi:hypothetical protein
MASLPFFIFGVSLRKTPRIGYSRHPAIFHLWSFAPQNSENLLPPASLPARLRRHMASLSFHGLEFRSAAGRGLPRPWMGGSRNKNAGGDDAGRSGRGRFCGGAGGPGRMRPAARDGLRRNCPR